MPRTFSTHVTSPPIDWLTLALEGKLEITGINVWKALRHPSFVQILDKMGEVLHEVSKLSTISGFRVTQRGRELLEAHESTILPFKKNDPPPNIRYWLSAFRRLARNCPQGLQLTFAEGELRVLAVDTQGVTQNDDMHLVESVKVPWHVVKK